MKVELFGEDEAFPDYDWIDKNAERAPFLTYLFRGKAIAGKRKAKRILNFFFVDKNDLNLFFSEEGHQAEYEYVSVSGKKNDEGFVITIKMKETL